ncbi:MAG: hypothetical protein GDA68_20465 [Nitrospira sp. CR2.1]|nr:hypothetical protein [Nitrospira sp. CR2.1]
MNSESLRLALEQLKPDDWRRFEYFASKFLLPGFPNLRSVSGYSNDRGRDGELFSPDGEPTVFLQYSITPKWDQKIRATASKICKTFKEARILIFVSNQEIGARADNVIDEVRTKTGLVVEIRDKGWFLDRADTDESRRAAVRKLVQDILEPFLAGREIIQRKARALSDVEEQAALIYLALQWEDATRDKGLTRLSFEALVRAVLRDSNTDQRMPREQIKSRVRAILSTHDAAVVDRHTETALSRMKKQVVRHHTKDDTYCLTFQEAEQTKGRLITLEHEDRLLDNEIIDYLRCRLKGDDLSPGSDPTDAATNLCSVARRILEKFLLSRGELFAATVSSGRTIWPKSEDLRELIISELSTGPKLEVNTSSIIDLILGVVREILLEPTPAVQRYLRRLADAYTLLAFLHETPDVQGAVQKMFSHGEIWIDTNIALPLFAETLLEPDRRAFTNMLRTASDAGLKLWVTNGVIEEIDKHMLRSIARAKCDPARWDGEAPYLFSMYSLARGTTCFTNWIEQFRGVNRPQDDILEYLETDHQIRRSDHSGFVENAPDDFRLAVQDLWLRARLDRESLQRRQAVGSNIDKLVRHDIENYIGVIERRKGESESIFGYQHWWLTLDRTAYNIEQQLPQQLGIQPPPSPILTADFLVNYLAFGPLRRQVPKQAENALPLAVDLAIAELLPPELLQIAEAEREKNRGLAERVIRRKVRDSLDTAKRRVGKVTIEGLDRVEREILQGNTSLE